MLFVLLWAALPYVLLLLMPPSSVESFAVEEETDMLFDCGRTGRSVGGENLERRGVYLFVIDVVPGLVSMNAYPVGEL